MLLIILWEETAELYEMNILGDVNFFMQCCFENKVKVKVKLSLCFFLT